MYAKDIHIHKDIHYRQVQMGVAKATIPTLKVAIKLMDQAPIVCQVLFDLAWKMLYSWDKTNKTQDDQVGEYHIYRIMLASKWLSRQLGSVSVQIFGGN